MTSGINFDLKLTGFQQFLGALDPATFNRLLRKHVGAATRLNGLLLKKRVRERIRSGVPPRNAALTMLIKGSSKPLVDRGDLFGAVTSAVISWDRAEVGFLRTSGANNIGEILTRGAIIPVTDKMRAMFKALAMVADGSWPASKLRGRALELWNRRPGLPWKPLKDSTKAIVIPPRPFMRQAFTDQATIDECLATWRQAVQDAIDEAVEDAKRKLR